MAITEQTRLDNRETIVPATRAPRADPPTRRPIRRSTKLGLALVAVLSILEITAFATHYLLVTSRYVVTDNAAVDGRASDLVAPVSGVLTRWEVQEGDYVRARQPLGRVRVGGSGGPQWVVRAPADGQVARSLVADGEWVTAGHRLVTTFDGDGAYVTARVPEEEVSDVQVGAPVDIEVDAFDGSDLRGVVTEVQTGTAGRFTVYSNIEEKPSSTDRIEQYVAVRVAFVDTGKFEPRPGMNVTVRISRR